MTRSPSVGDEHWMRLALLQARAASQAGEVAVGAVIVQDGELISHGHNASIRSSDPSAHAEMVALRRAAKLLGNYRLPGCELFVTLEPCVMCAGAMLHARLKRVVFGASDPKTGAAGSVVDIFSNSILNHQTHVRAGVLQRDCADELQDFFDAKRRQHTVGRLLGGTAIREDALRTPEHCFVGTPNLPGTSMFVHDLPALNGLRLHYLDTRVGGTDGVRVALHAADSWCLVWRDDLVRALAQGQRMLCPDLLGFGKSDKPKRTMVHTLQWHLGYLTEWIHRLDLHGVTLVVPATLRGLASELMKHSGGHVQALEIRDPPALDAQQANAPFPDNGHRAGPRACGRLFS